MDNTLYPVFLKLEELSVLVIGGGKVAVEKLESLLGNAPATRVKLVAKEISHEIGEMQQNFPNISLHERAFVPEDFDEADIAIAAVNSLSVAEEIRTAAREKKILVNIADKPALCDFYLGSIVKKNSLKIAISTNGKSPTVAKRIREMLTEMIPDDMEILLGNMQNIRNRLHGDFSYKVQELNRLTTEYLYESSHLEKRSHRNRTAWKQISLYPVMVAFLTFVLLVLLVIYLFVGVSRLR